MRRLQINAFGEATRVVTLESFDIAALANDEVLVRMEAAALDASDMMLISGRYGYRPSFPYNLGSEGVGRVIEAGTAAASLAGKRVMILPTYEQGIWAEQVVVNQRNVVEVSDKAEARQLAMIGINPATAYLLLKKFKHLMPGDWIAQTAANSAMGQYIVQLAKLAGLKTLNVVRRPEAAQQVREFGGDEVVFQDEKLADQIKAALKGKQLSLVLDSVGGSPVGEMMHFLKDGGAAVGYGMQSGTPPQPLPIDMYFRGLSFHGFWLIDWIRNAPHQEVRDTYRQLSELVAEGALFAEVEQAYPLVSFHDALEHAQKSHRSGKIVFQF